MLFKKIRVFTENHKVQLDDIQYCVTSIFTAANKFVARGTEDVTKL
jgi:hypothetical protein